MSEHADPRPGALLSWFARHRRPLPWRVDRGRPDAYTVLVSEVMCQQTRVQTVIPYFERWMARLPDLAALAAAPESEVLALWTGLGYYRRARNLQRCALVALERHGAIPADLRALTALPGVGPYTAGALASLAFGLPAALVDGNVARVLARWHAIDRELGAGPGRRALWARARKHLADPVARADPGRWNEALMELGALVCTPRAPLCPRCPVRTSCRAARCGLADKLPARRQRTPPTPVRACYAVLLHGDRLLLGRRAETGRWPGLWEPPGWEGPGAADHLRAFVEGLGLPPDSDPIRLRHLLSHRRYEVTAHRIMLDGPRATATVLDYEAQRWLSIDLALASDSGLSRLAQRIVAAGVDHRSAGWAER